MELRPHLKTPHNTVGTFPISTTGLINHYTFWLLSTFSSFPCQLFKFFPHPSSPFQTFPLSYTLIFFCLIYLFSSLIPCSFILANTCWKAGRPLALWSCFSSNKALWSKMMGFSRSSLQRKNGCPQRTLPLGLAPGSYRPASWTLSSRCLSVCRCMMSAQFSALRPCLISLRWSKPEGLLPVKNACSCWPALYLDCKMIINLTLVPSLLQFQTTRKCFPNCNILSNDYTQQESGFVGVWSVLLPLTAQ